MKLVLDERHRREQNPRDLLMRGVGQFHRPYKFQRCRLQHNDRQNTAAQAGNHRDFRTPLQVEHCYPPRWSQNRGADPPLEREPRISRQSRAPQPRPQRRFPFLFGPADRSRLPRIRHRTGRSASCGSEPAKAAPSGPLETSRIPAPPHERNSRAESVRHDRVSVLMRHPTEP